MSAPKKSQSVEFGFERVARHKLGEQLVNITGNLTPGPGYQLTLDGVAAAPVLFHELEAMFDAELDPTSGATLEFGFDASTGGLALQQLRWAIKGMNGAALLSRTSLGYIPTLRIRDKDFVPRDVGGHIQTKESGAALLVGFGIDTPSLADMATYPTWKNQLLATGKSWHLVEKRELPRAISMSSTETVIIQNEESYNPETFDINQIRSVQHRTSYGFETSPVSQVFTRVIELAHEGGEETFRTYERHHTSAQDLIDGTFEDGETKIFAAPLTEDSFNSYRSLLEGVQLEILAIDR